MTKTYIDELAEEIARLREENKRLKEENRALAMGSFPLMIEGANKIEKLKELLKECGNGLDKIKHIAEVKNLAAIYQVAERTLARIDEALK